MSVKFVGPFLSTEEGDNQGQPYLYDTYFRADNVLNTAVTGTQEVSFFYNTAVVAEANILGYTVFEFYEENGDAFDVDANSVEFISRQLSNVLNSSAEDVVISVDYPKPFVTKNIYTSYSIFST